MTQPKKLIEVALPIREISTESLRDKSIRHGHISTLHLWWARRPLPVCRAVVFASIVPDPLDPHCPAAFREAVQLILGLETGRSDFYKPYEDIPHTAVEDRMEDHLRNRLLMFIGKFSEKYVLNEKNGKSTPAKNKLSDHSLIKWDNKNNETILQRARRLIYVAHNGRLDPDRSARELIAEHDRLWAALKKAEKELYTFPDRHLGGEPVEKLEIMVEESREAFLSRMPKVFDPFAGGGAIPLEAARLGCRSYGNDINPVAHIIQRGSVEFPQKYGKPLIYSPDEFIRKYGKTFHETWRREHMTGPEDPVKVDNRLALDVEYFAHEILNKVEERIGQYYPKDEKGKRPIAYYWARVGTCSNPTCRAKVPLLKQFYLVNKPGKKIHLKPVIHETEIDFEIREGKIEKDGWVSRGNLACPCCHNVTDVKTLKKQFKKKETGERLIAVIEDSTDGKIYRLPYENEVEVLKDLSEVKEPLGKMPVGNKRNFNTPGWGVDHWDQMFSPRQLLAMQTFVSVLNNLEQQWYSENGNLSDYDRAVLTYLAIWVDRVEARMTSFGLWHITGEKLEYPFGRQAIPMVFDYPEANPFSNRTGSALNQLNWITRYLNSESFEIPSVIYHAYSGVRSQFGEKELDVVVTDPPYYDAIAYADLSDFFYVWLKRTLGTVFPENFITPQTPKEEECTALKHHHQNNGDQAREHFDHTLTRIFDAIEYQTRDLVSIMFAHQSTEAWTTLCNAILSARMNITGSWAMDSEYTNTGLKKSKDFLTSSVTVSCRPIVKKGLGDFQMVRREVRQVIREEVKKLYALGFRGADLLTACFGQAVSVFGRYGNVETPDGAFVSVAQLLSLARDAAFEAIVQDIPADERTRFYIGWLQLYGFSEAEHDDVMRLAQMGLNMDRDLIYRNHLLIKKDNRAALGRMAERIKADKKLGESKNSDAIDKAHRLIYLWQSGHRSALLQYIHHHCPAPDHVVWRVLNSLLELLPAEKKFRDRELVTNLMAAQESLLREVRAKESVISEQSEIDFQNMIDQEILNKGLGLFLEAMRQYIPALMMKKYGKRWSGKYYEALAPAQQRIWDTNNRDGEKPPQLMIDFGNLANFAIKNKALLRKEFDRDVNNLPAQFNQIAEARNMVAHFDRFDEKKARLAFLQMDAIARKLRMTELIEELTALQSGKSGSKPEPTADKHEKGFLPPWFSIVKPHMDIQMGQLDESVFAADLSEVALGTGREIYVNHSWFFEKTYFTEGLRNIGRRVIQCLNGGEAGENRVITLQTGFGGGKTHTLISLYHMVKAGPALEKIEKISKAIGVFPKSADTRVAVFTNRTNDPVQGRKDDDVHIRTLWGELAWQIGGREGYETVRENDEKGVAPGGNLFKKILNETGPVLILIDELADYCVKASAVERGQSTLSDQTISFMQDLTESVSQCNHAVMVVTLPASVTEVANSTLAQSILTSLSDRVARVGADTRPVAEDEIFEVIRHRLFERIGEEDVRKDVVSQYVGYYQKLYTDLPGYAPKSEYREMMERSYPFHPELINIFRNKWASHPNFQRTRGVLRILASIVSDLWKRRQSLTGEQAMIHPSHVELANLNTLTGEVKKLYGNGYDAVITQDISGTGSNARIIDDEKPTYGTYRLTQGIATTIFLNTFGSDGVNRGIEVSHLKLQMISSNGFNHNSINGSLDEFQGKAYYLYYTTSGGAQRFWFHTKPNINILINKAQSEIDSRDVEEYILDALRKATARISRIRVVIVPESDMPEQRSPLLVMVSPEITAQDTKKIESYCREIVTKKGNSERIYRNVFVFMSMSRDLRNTLYHSVRTLLASEKVNGEYRSQLGEDQVEDLRERIASLKNEVAERLISSYPNVHKYSVSGGLQSLQLMRFSRNFENQIGENLMELLKENYWLLEKVGTGVLERSGLLPKDEEPVTTSEVVEALLRFDDKPMIESPRVITESLSHYMYEGQFAIGVWSGEEFSRMYYRETIPQFDATDEIYRLVSKADYEKWRSTQDEDRETEEGHSDTGEIQDPGSSPGGTTASNPEPNAGESPEKKPEIIRSIVISGNLNPKDYQDFYRAFVYPLKDNHISMEITLRAASTAMYPLEKDHPKIKSMREAVRQLGLDMEEGEDY